MNTTSHSQSSLLMPALVLVGALTLLLFLLISQSVKSVHAAIPIVLDEAAVKTGRTTFMTVCAACHGPKALGVNGLGKPLVGSQFFNSRTDEEMLEFLHTGRPVNDPLNTTGVAMPARGGRVTLTDDDLLNVIQYIRSLNLPP
ncbi:MAG: cytochrome c [Anaerolineae bacterium]